MNEKVVSIAIDGPPGAGKSTMALLLSKRFHYAFLSSGALFRAFGYACYKSNINRFSEKEINDMATKTEISVKFINDVQYNYVNGECVNDFLYNPTADLWAVDVAPYIAVREKIKKVQQEFAKSNSVVIEGRDIGSVILPNATYKFYLDAPITIRAKRRYIQYNSQGKKIKYKDVLKEMEEREYKEIHREHSPLIVPKGAILVDVKDKNIEQVLNEIASHIKG